MMDTAIMDEPTQTDAQDASTSPLPPPGARRRSRWSGPTAYEIISDHLDAHGSITAEIAKELYGISNGSFNSTISDLKHDGWVIGTSKYRDDGGRSRSKYHVINEYDTVERTVQAASVDPRPASVEHRIRAVPDGKKVPASPPSKEPDTVAIRIGKDGIELQIAAIDDAPTSPFFKLGENQIKYLFENLSLYLDMKA
jgi:hypothetical protein